MIDLPSQPDRIAAVLFDMDGTLIDSEVLTGLAVDALLREAGIEDASLDRTSLYGVTWAAISERLVARHPGLRGVCTEQALHARCHALWRQQPPPPIPGALQTLRAAHARVPTAIVTSSNLESVDALVARFELGSALDATVCSDDFTRSKPDPECYRLAASLLGVDPARCLVFEDSVAGLEAASAAGMSTVAVTARWTPAIAAAAPGEHRMPDFTGLPAPVAAWLSTATPRRPARRRPT